MKQLIINIYSCQNCGKDFEGEETYIILNLFPVCSFKCKFNVIYRILKTEYSNENLEFMHKTLKKNHKNYEFNKNIALFELSKYFSKFTLSNVISVFSFLILNKLYSRNVRNSHFLMFSTPLYNKGVSEKVSLRTFENIENEKGGIKIWF